MRSHLSNILALSLILAGACGASTKSSTTAAQNNAASAPAQAAAGLKIKLTTVYVDDQEKALRFYTDVLGFAKKDDFTNGPYGVLAWRSGRKRAPVGAQR